MVPAHSHKVSRVSWYSGSRHVNSSFAYGAFTLSGRLSQNLSARIDESIMRSEPRNARIPVWPLPRSLAATCGIDVSFSSSGYLDVSVHRVPSVHLWIQCTVTEGDQQVKKIADNVLKIPRTLNALVPLLIL